ncbi:MAG: SHOCT-like domain-containing protein, partial [Aggregatilineales bacterium]
LGEIISSQISQQLSRLEQTLAERAEAVAQRAAGRARDRGKRAARMWTWSGEADAFAPKPPRAQPSPVTEAERLAILRMVEERKITIDEAERLLAALEGRE